MRKLQNWDRWTKAFQLATGVSGWDRHTLRRTTATMAGMGAPPHVISALLGHRNIGGQLVAGYSKAQYSYEAGEVLQLVADRLEAIEKGQDQSPSSAEATATSIEREGTLAIKVFAQREIVAVEAYELARKKPLP